MTIAGEQGETSYGRCARGAPADRREVPAEHRDAIKASVAALARRSAEASGRALERSGVLLGVRRAPPFSGFSSSWARLDGQVIPLTADFTD
jgi:hypothetical protein